MPVPELSDAPDKDPQKDRHGDRHPKAEAKQLSGRLRTYAGTDESDCIQRHKKDNADDKGFRILSKAICAVSLMEIKFANSFTLSVCRSVVIISHEASEWIHSLWTKTHFSAGTPPAD